MYSKDEILKTAQVLGVTFDKFTIDDLITGINIELEHGTINYITNVTNDDLVLTMKIALAHLNEFPNYYNKEYGLPAMEENLNSEDMLISAIMTLCPKKIEILDKVNNKKSKDIIEVISLLFEGKVTVIYSN